MFQAPSILLITPNWPLGATFGGQLRTLHTARALKQLGRLTVLVAGSSASDVDGRIATENEFTIEPPVREHISPASSTALLRRAFDPGYLNVHGVAASAADRARVLEYQRRYDLIWINNGRTPNILQVWRWPRTHLDIDDVPSTRFLGNDDSGIVQRLRNRTRRLLLRNREAMYPRRFTTLSVCSEADRRYLRLPHVHVIPNGFARPAATPVRRSSTTPPRLGFIGLYSHIPNLDGMRWFFRDVWPRIRVLVPGIRFRLAGRDTDGELRPDAPDVDVLGWLPDPTAEIATWSAMVIPIRFGGGTRIKIADAFSRKCPVVSTTFGAYGYDVADGAQLRLADEPQAFAEACAGLVRNPFSAAALAERAWLDFLEKWTWDSVTPRIVAAAEDCLRRSAQSSCAEYGQPT